MVRYLWIWIVALIVAWWNLGCSSSDQDVRTKTADTTRIVEALAAAASRIEHTRVPNDLLNPDEEDDGRSTYLPAKPLHTSDFEIIEEFDPATGHRRSRRLKLLSKPDDFIAGVMGGAEAIDAQKYAERNSEREFNQRTAIEWREWVIGLANSPLGQRVIDRLMPADDGGAAEPISKRERVLQFLADPRVQDWLMSDDGQVLLQRLIRPTTSSPSP